MEKLDEKDLPAITYTDGLYKKIVDQLEDIDNAHKKVHFWTEVTAVAAAAFGYLVFVMYLTMRG